MAKVLLVEDSRFYGGLVRNRLVSDVGVEVLWVRSLDEMRSALADASFLTAVLDLHLSDALDGQTVDVALEAGLSSIVLTGQLDDDLRASIWEKQIVDYVLKDGPQALETIVEHVRRLQVNQRVKVLVVDDSALARTMVRSRLLVHRYTVLQAASGQEALEVLEEHPDVSLMLVDYQMSGMDGFELVRRVRKTHHRDVLAIVGMSAHGGRNTSARFLKAGANDFLHKPFETEEFYCRVGESVRALEHIRELERMATRDFLTGLYNRRHFFSAGQLLCANALRGHLALGFAMLDIDHFKRVNDTYGHDVGDEVLKVVASLVEQRFRSSDLVARLGGEEFAVLTSNMDATQAQRIFDELRQKIEATPIRCGEATLRVTISVGLCTGPSGRLEDMMKRADTLLYEAKGGGRNRVVCDTSSELAVSPEEGQGGHAT